MVAQSKKEGKGTVKTTALGDAVAEVAGKVRAVRIYLFGISKLRTLNRI